MIAHTRRRRGFTLIELCVVFMVIAVLVWLLSSAVLKALGKLPEVQTATEIAQMSLGLQNLKVAYSLQDDPPSHLVLWETAPFGGDPSTVLFLQKMFGRTLGMNQPYIDWNGNGLQDGPWILEGEQCLVFYLGGIPSAQGPQGFAASNINPALITPGSKRSGPFYQFQVNRLAKLPTPSGVFFPMYLDPYNAKNTPAYAAFGGTPYLYFSSQGIMNSVVAPLVGYQVTDCATITALVGGLPYKYLTGGYVNPIGNQILSAGHNGTFGFGVWDANSGTVIPNVAPPPAFLMDKAGADDQANFGKGLLGSGQ